MTIVRPTDSLGDYITPGRWVAEQQQQHLCVCVLPFASWDYSIVVVDVVDCIVLRLAPVVFVVVSQFPSWWWPPPSVCLFAFRGLFFFFFSFISLTVVRSSFHQLGGGGIIQPPDLIKWRRRRRDFAQSTLMKTFKFTASRWTYGARRLKWSRSRRLQ